MDRSNSDQLSISWHDSAWILINQNNVLDYFSERSNPFYDNKCNNEQIKMQRLSMDQLNNMVGNEYILLHVQEPILYVIRKQYRHSPTHVTPTADYYIIAGVVYQAPDLCSVITSRLLNTVHDLQSAFDEAHSYSRYHPSKGYWWDFKNHEDKDKAEKKEKKKKEEPSSIFQRQRVDMLLAELGKKYPLQFITHSQPDHKEETAKIEMKSEVKSEKVEDKSNTSMKPPEKRAKLIR